MTALLQIDVVVFKRLDKSTFNSMMGVNPPAGSGRGQRDIRLGRKAEVSLLFGDGVFKEEVSAVGSGEKAVMEASPQAARGGEWRIVRQNLERHPAWSADAGFPEGAAPDDLPRVHLWLARTASGEYFAGLVDEDGEELLPTPIRQKLADASNTTTTGFVFEGKLEMMSLARAALTALHRKPCVLLYGPPGTGKTRALQEVMLFLRKPDAFSALRFDPQDASIPFRLTSGPQHEFTGDVAQWWLTFHQGTTYHDVVLGLRPRPEAGGVVLEPRAGPLLEALEYARKGNTSFLFIDEINRGNVPEILGDFITFMEWEKRLAVDGSRDPLRSIPLTYPALDRDQANAGKSVPVRFSSGGAVPLSLPYFVPHSVYMIATMNSLDRSVAPLDTALARRFRRVEASVDLVVLEARLQEGAGSEHAALACDLLKRLNGELAARLGEDFQLGQAYLWNAFDSDGLNHTARLSGAWEEEIFPQLRELCRMQPDALAVILRADEGLVDWPWRIDSRSEGYGLVSGNSDLLSASGERQLRILRGLAGRPQDTPSAEPEAVS